MESDSIIKILLGIIVTLVGALVFLVKKKNGSESGTTNLRLRNIEDVQKLRDPLVSEFRVAQSDIRRLIIDVDRVTLELDRLRIEFRKVK